MRREYIFILHSTWFLFFLHFQSLYVHAEESGDEYSKGCTHLHCESGSRCIKRRFWCKEPPCPGMLYCSKSRKESLKGPRTCDTVRCSRGHICAIKVRECRWDEQCKQQIARCVSEKEYYEGAVSCVGFECPSGKRCILRETYCVNPPCKLIRSCAEMPDVQTWFDECRSLNCTSEYECFLRRPENNCLDARCTHTSDCTFTVEDELISKYCRSWICPRSQKCVVRIVGTCKGFNCTVERSCRAFDKVVEQPPTGKTLVQMESNLVQERLERKMNSQTIYSITGEKSTLTSSTLRSSLRHTTPTKYDTEISLTHRQTATTSSDLIAKSFESSINQDSTLPYPKSSWNYNKPSTNDVIEITSELADSTNATSPTILLAEEKIESTTSRDAERLEMPKKVYIASNTLSFSVVLDGINFVGHNYPIWIKNDPHPTELLEIEDENDNKWGYTPQEPYRILLPPYEPVILVEDTREREVFPFLTYVFNRQSFNEATAFISLPKITSTDTKTAASKTDDISTIVDDKNGNYINDSVIVEAENVETNYFNDSSGYYTKFSGTEETNVIITPKIRPGTNNYYDVSMLRAGQSDYSSRDEKLYGLAKYPYDTISVDDVDKSQREYEGSRLNKISYISLNEEGNQSDIPFAFPLDRRTRRGNELIALIIIMAKERERIENIITNVKVTTQSLRQPFIQQHRNDGIVMGNDTVLFVRMDAFYCLFIVSSSFPWRKIVSVKTEILPRLSGQRIQYKWYSEKPRHFTRFGER